MNGADLARLDVARRAYKATQPGSAEVQTGVRRARLSLRRPKGRRSWFSKGLVLIVLAVGGLAYAKPHALGDLVGDMLPQLRAGAKPVAKLPGGVPSESLTPATLAQPRAWPPRSALKTTPPPATTPAEKTAATVTLAANDAVANNAAPSHVANNAVANDAVANNAAPRHVENNAVANDAVASNAAPRHVANNAVASNAAANVAAPGHVANNSTPAKKATPIWRAAGTTDDAPLTDAAPATAASSVSDWGRVGQALARGDENRALAALRGLSESDDQRTRDKADLGRAQLLMAHGDRDGACSLARSLTHRRAGGRIERQAQALLRSCLR